MNKQSTYYVTLRNQCYTTVITPVRAYSEPHAMAVAAAQTPGFTPLFAKLA